MKQLITAILKLVLTSLVHLVHANLKSVETCDCLFNNFQNIEKCTVVRIKSSKVEAEKFLNKVNFSFEYNVSFLMWRKQYFYLILHPFVCDYVNFRTTFLYVKRKGYFCNCVLICRTFFSLDFSQLTCLRSWP
jgi:hypothetical protein